MNAWQQLRSQTAAVYGSLAPSQRLTMGLVAALLLGWFAFLTFRGTSHQYTPLSVGKAFTVEEAMHAEEVLLEAGLTDFRKRGSQILVPASQVSQYNAALIAGGGLPTNWAEQWEHENDKLGQFSGTRQREAAKEIARSKIVNKMLRDMPDVANANVVWDEDARPGWNSMPRGRATVSVKPKPGRDLSPQLIRSIRLAVANSKSHLDANDVVVIDLSTGRSYDGNDSGEFGDEVLARVHRFTEMYRTRIMEQLSYIPGVRVAVNVNLENLRGSKVRRQKINPKETLAVVGDSQRLTDSSTRRSPAAEPGGGPNVQLNLQSQGGGGQSRDVTENRENTVQTASFEITEDELVGLMPESISVAISVPMAFYRARALASPAIRDKEDVTEDEIQAVADSLELETAEKIKTRVAQMIAGTGVADPAATPVVVDSIYLPEDTEVLDAVPLTETVFGLAQSWGRPLLLLGIAAVALVMLNQSLKRPMPEMPEFSPPTPGASASSSEDEDDEAEEDDLPLLNPPENKKREHLQAVVRDNPELAAAVINQWILEK